MAPPGTGSILRFFLSPHKQHFVAISAPHTPCSPVPGISYFELDEYTERSACIQSIDPSWLYITELRETYNKGSTAAVNHVSCAQASISGTSEWMQHLLVIKDYSDSSSSPCCITSVLLLLLSFDVTAFIYYISHHVIDS